jgi:hypothetical protein
MSGTFLIDEELRVHRLGCGVVRLAGKDIWGEPWIATNGLAVLRRATALTSPALAIASLAYGTQRVGEGARSQRPEEASER